ncbi:MAG: hypothetical protein Q8L14_20255 [Myxococcales bacterium]|nr:hypothetical protein [Myxococcales bacterium]
MKTEGGNASIFDAEAHAAMLRAAGAATAFGNALDEAVHALAAGGRDDLVRQVEKVAEFHRLTRARLAATLQSLERAS